MWTLNYIGEHAFYVNGSRIGVVSGEFNPPVVDDSAIRHVVDPSRPIIMPGAFPAWMIPITILSTQTAAYEFATTEDAMWVANVRGMKCVDRTGKILALRTSGSELMAV